MLVFLYTFLKIRCSGDDGDDDDDSDYNEYSHLAAFCRPGALCVLPY